MQELAFRTQYAELKERSSSVAALLAGTPGTLFKREGTGYAYWYRVYYQVPGIKAEQLIGKDGDQSALDEAQRQIEFAQWVNAQVRNLRHLGFQVADKGVASVLVELHNRRLLEAGLVLVGTLAYMAWLNELGARAIASRTQDVDLATGQHLKLGAPASFLEAMNATKLGFSPVPQIPSQAPSTSLKLKGREGLRVDLLVQGKELGKPIAIPQLMWHAEGVPFFDYLLDDPHPGAALAGGHCISLMLPRAERFVWHKLYSSASRKGFPEKAAKDLLQAATLAAILTEHQDEALTDSFGELPTAMQPAVKRRLPALRRALASHPQTLEQFELTLGT
ncbi:MAG: nucleotidyltransferase domain-containing protein [Gammaproteobacteria bacterium]|nr:nucleotidyltransferase domain-containing protein [Gammaproteobacteria bacterium]MBU1440092.1 nucleotidyltransferase domain-containing protein [Gammaproteobacteria bacterium]